MINSLRDDYSIIKDGETEDKKDIEHLAELKKTLDSALKNQNNKEGEESLRFSKNSNTLKSDFRKSNKTINNDSFTSKEIENCDSLG